MKRLYDIIIRTFAHLHISILALLICTSATAQYQQAMTYRDYSVHYQMRIGFPGQRYTDSSAYLELGTATNSKRGFLNARGSMLDVISPKKGLLFHDTIYNEPVWHDGVNWRSFRYMAGVGVSITGSGTPSDPWVINATGGGGGTFTNTDETDQVAQAKTISLNAGPNILITGSTTQSLGGNPSWTIEATGGTGSFTDEDDYRTSTQISDSSYRLNRPNGSKTVYIFEVDDYTATKLDSFINEYKNFANADLTATGDRTHNFTGNELHIYNDGFKFDWYASQLYLRTLSGNSGIVWADGDTKMFADVSSGGSDYHSWTDVGTPGIMSIGASKYTSGTPDDVHTVTVQHDAIELGKGGVATGTSLRVFARSLPVYDSEAAATTAGLESDRLYKTSTGEIRIKL